MVFKILVVISSLLFFIKTTSSMTVNYVKPFAVTTASPCSDVQRPCLTLNEYASDSDEHFVNNTIFYFYPGIHRLDYSLILENLCNFSFHSWPSDRVITIAVDSFATIIWKESWNIKISLIHFTLYDNFTFIMRFEHSQLVQLSNISIFGNGYNGCSSIISQGSALDINNASFIGIKGFLGAALMILASNITFRGSNVFAGNTAASGGSIYLIDSRLTLSGASLFLNNTSLRYSGKLVNRKISLCNCLHVEDIKNGSGGAIFCSNSYLRIHEHSSFTANVAKSSGGAILVITGELTIQGNASFRWNTADGKGGAVVLYNTRSTVNGNLSLKNNVAFFGGAISVVRSNCFIQGYILFDRNSAAAGSALYLSRTNFKFYDMATFRENYNGSAIRCRFSNITLIGAVYFYTNMGYKGGAIRNFDSNVIFSGSVTFDRNMAFQGGAMNLEGASKLIFKPKLSTSFILNHANNSGGALYFRDSEAQCSLGSKAECFITIDGSFISTSYISLHFENNSAGVTGSILYGGQLDKCRLFFRNSTEQSDLCVSNNHRDYSDNALETLMNLSTIVEHENSTLDILSSPAKEIKFCEGNERSMWLSDEYKYITAYPGGKFNINLIALGQTDYPVPARILWERYEYSEYRLSPPSRKIDALCTRVSFKLHSIDFTDKIFKLYPQNPCQNLIEGLILNIQVLPCPLGFALSENDSRCVCDKKLKTFARSCYIDSILNQ